MADQWRGPLGVTIGDLEIDVAEPERFERAP